MTHKGAPVRTALAVSVAVLVGYLVTLAPSVTFWDAGEFITAARTLGIPHPPGTPLFVLLTSVWGRLVPFGEYAWRINLFSATCTAAAAGCWFLVVHDVVERLHPEIDERSRRAFASLGGVGAALITSFSFTAWQSATETEVYATTTLSVAVVALLATQWRRRRGDAAGSRLLLAALYLGALSVGNHLMGLLVGPALVAALVVESGRSPLIDAVQRNGEWGRIAVVATAWVLLVGIGLGNTVVVIAGAVLFAAATGWAARARQFRFAIAAMVLIVVGASTFAFLVLRAHQQPWLNSGDPSSWHHLLDVIRRAQYPPRTPLDDPTVLPGPANPGRTLTLLAYQVANYAQYFDWQWASGFGDLARASVVRLAFTLLMATLGVRGAFAQRRRDPTSFAFVGMLFLTAGPVLLLYLNFKPGPSIGWDRWLILADHEVRDRDYFFVASFVAWGVWVAIALVELVRDRLPMMTGWRRQAMPGLFAFALLPFALNYCAATRHKTAEATLPGDFAHALLASVPPNAVLFTYGDNDTFPLWYMQQVEGFRTDVDVVCLSLAQAAWYIDRLGALHSLSPQQVAALRPFRTPRELTFDLGGHGVATIASGVAVYPSDVMTIEILRKNAGHRPVAWSISATDALYGLAPQLVQQGLALVLPMVPIDSTALVGGAAAAPGGTRLDLPATRALIDGSWRFSSLESRGPDGLDANIRAIAGTIAAPFTQAGIGLLMRGDTAGGVLLLRRSVRLADDSLAGVVLKRLGAGR